MSIKLNEFENSKTICYLQRSFLLSVTDFQLFLRVLISSVFLAAKSIPGDFSAATVGTRTEEPRVEINVNVSRLVE